MVLTLWDAYEPNLEKPAPSRLILKDENFTRMFFGLDLCRAKWLAEKITQNGLPAARVRKGAPTSNSIKRGKL